MKIKSIKVNNFLSFREEELKLKDGVFLVVGRNGTEEDSSNGSGKSALFVDAPTWLFFDITTRGIRFNDVIRTGTKLCNIGSIVEDGGKEYIVNRERKFGKASVITIDGKKVEQEDLEAFLGVDYNTFTSAIVHPQDFINFAEKNDKDRKSVLTKILDLERFDLYKDVAKKLSNQNKTDIDTYRNKIDNLNVLVERVEYEDHELDTKIANFENERLTSIQESKDNLEQINKKLKEIEVEKGKVEGIKVKLKQTIDANKYLTGKYETTFKEYNLFSKKSNDLTIESQVAEKELNNLKREKNDLVGLEGGKCPTCKQTVKGEEFDSCVSKYDEQIKNINSIITALLIEAKTVDEQFFIFRKEKERLEIVIRENTTIIFSCNAEIKALDFDDRNKALVNDKDRSEANIKKIEDQINPYLKMKEDRKTEVNKYIEEKNKYTEEITMLDGYQKYCDFWVDGFGNSGIKSFIFDSIIPEFTLKANQYVQELSDGEISVEFDTQTEKKSGGISDKFSITITDDIGKRPFEAWSGGEKKRISIAIGLALSDLVSSRTLKKWDFAVFDEMLDGLDSDGKSRIISMLDDMKRENASLYIISHDVELKNVFDNTILIEKTKGISHIIN